PTGTPWMRHTTTSSPLPLSWRSTARSFAGRRPFNDIVIPSAAAIALIFFTVGNIALNGTSRSSPARSRRTTEPAAIGSGGDGVVDDRLVEGRPSRCRVGGVATAEAGGR